MTRKYSEDAVRAALNDMDLDVYVFKPTDAPGPTQNTKPADFLLWWVSESARPAYAPLLASRSAWLEVKETPAVDILNLPALFTPSQIAGMRRAAELALPYLAAIRWARHKDWTITTGDRILARIDTEFAGPLGKYLRREMPITCVPGQLAGFLRGALLGEID